MRTLSVLVPLALATAALSVPAGAIPVAWSYEGAGSIVVSEPTGGPTGEGTSPTLLDNGAVTCNLNSKNGLGGICIPFGSAPNAIFVHDDNLGRNVAFQVCVDVNGDGICGGSGGGRNETNTGCEDRILFSHSSFTGSFANPAQIPFFAESVYHSCQSTGFAGYVVIICGGVHRDNVGLHTHRAVRGTVSSVPTGSHLDGDFCGAPTAAKAYVVR